MVLLVVFYSSVKMTVLRTTRYGLNICLYLKAIVDNDLYIFCLLSDWFLLVKLIIVVNMCEVNPRYTTCT